jgi:hypothetical protein
MATGRVRTEKGGIGIIGLTARELIEGRVGKMAIGITMARESQKSAVTGMVTRYSKESSYQRGYFRQ